MEALPSRIHNDRGCILAGATGKAELTVAAGHTSIAAGWQRPALRRVVSDICGAVIGATALTRPFVTKIRRIPAAPARVILLGLCATATCDVTFIYGNLAAALCPGQNRKDRPRRELAMRQEGDWRASFGLPTPRM